MNLRRLYHDFKKLRKYNKKTFKNKKNDIVPL